MLISINGVASLKTGPEIAGGPAEIPRRPPLILLPALLGLLACGKVPVDLEAIPVAKASCEEPTSDLLLPDARMLPGRICQQCHTRAGQANRYKWTASGTVFQSTATPCNEGGLPDVLVEVLDQDDAVQATMVTNDVGNFFTDVPITFPIRARITRDGKTRMMKRLASLGSCASCHQKEPKNGAPGPLFLD